jgi:hypothetical protein
MTFFIFSNNLEIILFGISNNLEIILTYYSCMINFPGDFNLLPGTLF